MRFLLSMALAVWMTGAQAQEVLPRDQGIEGTIQSQIDAFLLDDFAQAFQYATPSIQQMFRTPEVFGDMVRRGYPMVWRPDQVVFGDLRAIEGALWQMVTIRDQSGALHVLDYRMEQGAGGWRIAGVQILPAPDPSV